MRSPRHLIVLGALALAAVATGCGGGDSRVPANAVAVVAQKPIMRSEYDALLNRAKVSYKTRGKAFPRAGTPEYQQLKQQALDILTQRAEFELEAERLGVVVTEKQVNDRLKQLKQQYFAGNEKRYKAQLKQSGLTEADLKEDIRSQLVSEAIYKKVTSDVKVADKDIETYYNQHKDQYTQPETRDVRHILVSNKKFAETLYDKVRHDKSQFAALARKYSKDPSSKKQGGKLTITRGQTVQEFDRIAFLIPTGSIARPVKTQYGYHIIQALGDVKPSKTTPLKEVRESIKQQLLNDKRQNAMAAWVKRTQKEFKDKIRYQVGFAPPKKSNS